MNAADMVWQAEQAAEALTGALPLLLNGSVPEAATVVLQGLAKGHPEFARAMADELRGLLQAHPDLAAAAREVRHGAARNGEWSALRERFVQTLERDQPKLDVIWSLLASAGVVGSRPDAPAKSPHGRRWLSSVMAKVETGGALFILTAIVLLPMAQLEDGTEQNLLRWFAVVVMASLPGWLFLRFIVFRAGSLWTDYVLHLHRLGMDLHQNLPEPPLSSAYHRLWLEGGGPALRTSDNIYQQKFEAYYGKAAGPGRSRTSYLRDRSIFTVVVATAIFAVGWAALLKPNSLLKSGRDLTLPLDALRFGFLGAYSFSLQMLMRRYFQSDLKASAYMAASVRVITVLILMLVLAYTGLLGESLAQAAPIGFIIGFFPLVGMQLLQRVVSAGLRRWVPTLRNPYPLSDLDGLNVWYEARMLEEGIEDMQNLVTANFVDVLLHTRVPVGRLVDWMDQAHLYLLLDPSEDDGSSKHRNHEDRLKLRRLGIRSATDLESAVTPVDLLAKRANAKAVCRLGNDDDAYVRALRRVLGRIPGEASSDDGQPFAIDGMLKTFCNMPNLVHVRHWRDVLASESCGTPPPPAPRGQERVAVTATPEGNGSVAPTTSPGIPPSQSG